MKRLLICALALLVVGPAFADEAGPDSGKKERAEARRKKKNQRDLRTSMKLPIGRLSSKNEAKVVEALTGMSAIDEATADVKNKEVEVKFASASSTGVAAIAKALRKSKTYLDMRRLKLKYPCTVKLQGPMTGAVFDRKMGKRHGFNSMAGQRLLRELKAINGIRSARWVDASNLKLGMDREIPYRTIATLIARHGSTSKGSGVIKDVTWTSEKLSPQDQKRNKKRRKK